MFQSCVASEQVMRSAGRFAMVYSQDGTRRRSSYVQTLPGAIVAGRLMCSDEMPTPAEIDHVLKTGHVPERSG